MSHLTFNASSHKMTLICFSGDGQVDFDEFMTILGPKLLSSETREDFLGNTIDNIFWQVRCRGGQATVAVLDWTSQRLNCYITEAFLLVWWLEPCEIHVIFSQITIYLFLRLIFPL